MSAMDQTPTIGDEEWRLAVGFPRYEVSSLGNIRRSDTKRLLKPRPRKNGYKRVYLGAEAEVSVNRLVCETFHGPPPEPDWHADHENTTRSDDSAGNLRWLSPPENRATRRFAKGEKNGHAKLTEPQVRTIKSLLSFQTTIAIAERFNVGRKTISDIKHRLTWRHVNG